MNEPTKEDLGRDLAADLALCEEATPGGWSWQWQPTGGHRILWPHSNGNCVARVWCDVDAAMVAASRLGWPAALRMLAAARAENDRLRRIIDGLTARVAAQSELLGQRAEKEPSP